MSPFFGLEVAEGEQQPACSYLCGVFASTLIKRVIVGACAVTFPSLLKWS